MGALNIIQKPECLITRTQQNRHVMNFLPSGSIEVNLDSTLAASVDCSRHCVYKYNVADRTVDPIFVGTAGTRGSVDTLLICDWGGGVMIASWKFLSVGNSCAPSPCHRLLLTRWVLLQYESGAGKPEVAIGSGTAGNADGRNIGLFCPSWIRRKPSGLAITLPSDRH